MFNDYPFEANPSGFRPRTVRAFAGAYQNIRPLSLADSIGIDFHKPGFAPYISSLLLVQGKEDLELLQRPQDQIPYLYQFGEQRPGMYSGDFEAGYGNAALANLKLFGKEGLRVIIGPTVEMAHLLCEHFEGHECTTVLNRGNRGTVILFRVYPEGVGIFHIKENEMQDTSFREVWLQHKEYN